MTSSLFCLVLFYRYSNTPINSKSLFPTHEHSFLQCFTWFRSAYSSQSHSAWYWCPSYGFALSDDPILHQVHPFGQAFSALSTSRDRLTRNTTTMGRSGMQTPTFSPTEVMGGHPRIRRSFAAILDPPQSTSLLYVPSTRASTMQACLWTTPRLWRITWLWVRLKATGVVEEDRTNLDCVEWLALCPPCPQCSFLPAS